ncbi:hypothetical protein N665_0041s0027 [Sinapis alba]|nr:hypothetical protein N665_0041s0027 [Sinapis alba]
MDYSSKKIQFDYDGHYANLEMIMNKFQAMVVYIDPCTKRLNLSYILLVVEPKRQSYILDDEDVFVYLTSVDKEGRRSILHVEVIEEIKIVPVWWKLY